MRNKTKSVSIVLFLSAFIMVISFGGQKAEWKGKIEIENGIKVIKNPRDPLYGEIKFDLEEDLSIGNEEDENYMFYRGVGIEVDSDGNIFVLPEENKVEVAVINSNGEKLETIASFSDRVTHIGRDGIPIVLSTPYDPELYFCPLNEEQGIYGYSSEYKLVVVKSSGEIAKIIKKEESPELITQKEKNRLIDRTIESYRKRERESALDKPLLDMRY